MIRVCEPEAANSANQNANKFVKSDMVVSNKVYVLLHDEEFGDLHII